MYCLRELTVTFHHKTVLVSCLQRREAYEKVLEDVTSCMPRYMEEMESIFEQSQEEERKRISFLKQAFLSIHRHLDITNNERWEAFRCEKSLIQWIIHLSVTSSHDPMLHHQTTLFIFFVLTETPVTEIERFACTVKSKCSFYCVMTEHGLCPFVSVKAVYNELHHTLMSISEQDDLKWWKNNRGPGMPTDWPKIEVR